MTAPKLPYTLYSVDHNGVNVPVAYDGNPFTAPPARVLKYGEFVVIDEPTYVATLDRNGVSWLDMTDDDQIARYGRIRWGRGEVPEHVLDQARADARRRAIAERDQLRRSNPHIARATAASMRVQELDAQIEALS